jgi:hypothetical protein
LATSGRDNRIDTTDATIVLRFAADIQPEPDFACPYDDVNCDGQMNAADSLVILAYVADAGYHSLQHQPCLELGQPNHPPLDSGTPSPSPVSVARRQRDSLIRSAIR